MSPAYRTILRALHGTISDLNWADPDSVDVIEGDLEELTDVLVDALGADRLQPPSLAILLDRFAEHLGVSGEIPDIGEKAEEVLDSIRRIAYRGESDSFSEAVGLLVGDLERIAEVLENAGEDV